MAICFIEGPGYALVELLYILPCRLCYMPHDAVHHLALAEALLADCHILWGYSPFAEINVSLFLVHTQDHDRLLPTNLQQDSVTIAWQTKASCFHVERSESHFLNVGQS